MNKKYFSKALCYADRTHYFFILMITSLYILFCGLLSLTNGPSTIPNAINITDTLIPLLIINTLIIFFSYNNKKTKRFYMATQPYGKDTMIITKLISFSLSFIVPLVIYGIIISLLYLTNTKGLTDVINSAVHSPLLQLWRNIFIVSVSFISIVSNIQFLQILFGKCKYALLIPFVFAGFIIPITITLILIYLTGVSSSLGNYLIEVAKRFANFFISYGNSIVNNPVFTLINDLVHIIIFTLLTIFLNRKVKNEKTDDIFMFKPIETICKVLLSVSIGFCLVSILGVIVLLIYVKITSSSINIDIPNLLGSIICILMISCGIALSVVSYKIINKIQSRRA